MFRSSVTEKNQSFFFFFGALQVATELWERLGNIGWSVVEMVHDPDRHPCEVVAEVSSADVLLTTHGFQVNFEVQEYSRVILFCLVCFIVLHFFHAAVDVWWMYPVQLVRGGYA